MAHQLAINNGNNGAEKLKSTISAMLNSSLSMHQQRFFSQQWQQLMQYQQLGSMA